MENNKVDSSLYASISNKELTISNELKKEGTLEDSQNCLQLEEENLLHSLPCQIEFTGSAQVSVYFNKENLHHENVRAASFRGHMLLNKLVKVPEGYEIYTVSESNAENKDDCEMKTFQLKGSTKSMNFWEKDEMPVGPNKIEDALTCILIAENLSN
ncbi:unnamed protein product [Meloidogyne enterolobii]|uniref:Uncharacterized protein n=1 Tax=Meloidogyne enterolobii TaxID=390850 RepID=A0ACB0ZN81_MELEN